ncbi:MAG: hypothetical protein KBD31_02810, partial [Proteobacteria bacterium]|nr:hypothetical protein [Pseudomonadota bacterium]
MLNKKFTQIFCVVASFLSATYSYGSAPNPFNGISYNQDMVLIPMGLENGRKVLKSPDDQKTVCAAFVPQHKVMRFGYVDGPNCLTHYAGSKPIDLNSGNAFLVHFKNNGSWVDLPVAKNDKLVPVEKAPLQQNGSKSYPAFLTTNKTTGAYFSEHNGTWSSVNGQEVKEPSDNNVKVFIPGYKAPAATPAPAGFDAEMYLGNYIDLQNAAPKDGNRAKWAQDHYNDYGKNEKRVTDRKLPKPLPTHGLPDDFDADQYLANYKDLQDASKNDGNKPLWAANHYKNFGINEKRSYKPLPANQRIDLGGGTFIMPMDEVKNNFANANILSTTKSADSLNRNNVDVCGVPIANGNDKQIAIGYVENADCLFDAWGNRKVKIGSGAYYVNAKGTFKKGKSFMLFKPNTGNHPTGVSKFGNKFGKTHPGFNDMYYGFEVSKKISDDGVLGFDPSDPSGKDEDQQSAAAGPVIQDAKSVNANGKTYYYDKSLDLVSASQLAGKTPLKDPKGNQVCAAVVDTTPEIRFNFGTVNNKNECMIPAWGSKNLPISSNNVWLVIANGNWQPLNDNVKPLLLSRNEDSRSASPMAMGLAQVDGIAATYQVNPGTAWWADGSAEHSRNDKTKIQVFIPAPASQRIDLGGGTFIMPMDEVKNNFANANILSTTKSADSLNRNNVDVCGVPIANGNDKQIAIGYVENADCLFDAWGNRKVKIGSGAYYVNAKGTFKKGKSFMLFKPNSGNYPTGVSKFGNKFGKTHPGFNDMYYGFEVSKKISDDGVLGFDPSDPSGKDEDQQSNAPNPFNGIAYSQDMELIRKGQENGRTVLTDPEKGKTACAAFIQGPNILRFGFVDGNNCITNAGNAIPVDLNSGNAFLINFKNDGSWVDLSAARKDNLLTKEKAPTTQLNSKAYPAFITTNKTIGGFYTDQNGVWTPVNGQEVKEGNEGNIKVFIPGYKAPAATPAPAGFDAEMYLGNYIDLQNAAPKDGNRAKWAQDH